MQRVLDKDDILLFDKNDDGVLRLTLNDNPRRNSLSEVMMHALKKAFDVASEDSSVRVIILAANGTVFCAGHNLKEMTAGRGAPDLGRDYFERMMTLCSDMMQTIVNCSKPVIGEVRGIATAAGCQLAASCDLVVASQSAQFSTPGVHIGLFCSTPMVALSRSVGNKHAMEMLLTGDIVSADRAYEIGLVNRVVAAEELQDATRELAQKIASKSSMTLATGKRAFYQQKRWA